MKQRNLLLI